MDPDILSAAAQAVAWAKPPAEPRDLRDEYEWFRDTLVALYDAAMPRSRGPPTRRSVYWWTAEIAALRVESIRARHRFTRARRRVVNNGEGAQRAAEPEYQGYRAAHKALRTAVMKAKSQAWKELMETLDADPWGRPYRLVMNKLRPWTPPITESLDPQLLEEVVSTLFPDGRGDWPPREPELDPVEWSNNLGVTEEELRRAVCRMARKNTAPGPDGVPGKVLGFAFGQGPLGDRLRQLLTGCLRTSWFPPD
ncbi:uncharacterized protein LOC109859974 [Pseudomyrmex gracilis]|uniref:uncharacterized protein LOC109859974 n=1 Tax=Pseudomyrmex gracilis TaxID=219809 RepID=UPI00099595AB|nr:uncharacterized protein LOC109859974 [Pseudomyrmex gracilis]